MGAALTWLLRRGGYYLLAAWAALTLNFAVPRLMPGDPASVLFGRMQGRMEPEAMDAMREAFGLTDDWLVVQYGKYLYATATGDMGISISAYPTPVSEVVAGGLFWTLLLAGGAVLISFGLGTVLGAVAAWRRGGVLDSVAPSALALLGAFPYFWLAMAAAFVLGFQLGWFPLSHAYALDLEPGFSLEFVGSVLYHATLPALTMVAVSLGGWLLSMRNTMIGVLGEDFVTYAEARGLPRRRILWRYAARNALLPNVTGFGMALGFVLSGALLTEIIFAYPGQGYLLLQAVRAQDYPLLQGLFLTITVAVLGANWLVDIVTVVLDPRTRS